MIKKNQPDDHGVPQCRQEMLGWIFALINSNSGYDSTVPGDLTRKSIQYSTGTATMVSMVPKVNPAMIVTAIPTQNTSCSKGMTPNTVVPAARTTGRRREIAESITAWYCVVNEMKMIRSCFLGADKPQKSACIR